MLAQNENTELFNVLHSIAIWIEISREKTKKWKKKERRKKMEKRRKKQKKEKEREKH